jgi:hypothetical protein
VCNSHTDSECSKETLPEEYKKDCADQIDGSKYVMCRKIVQNIDFEVNGSKYTYTAFQTDPLSHTNILSD